MVSREGLRLTSDSKKLHKGKSNLMNKSAFANLKQAFEDALAYERGNRRDLVVTRIQDRNLPKLSRSKKPAKPRS